jgi:hypothetical protein
VRNANFLGECDSVFGCGQYGRLQCRICNCNSIWLRPEPRQCLEALHKCRGTREAVDCYTNAEANCRIGKQSCLHKVRSPLGNCGELQSEMWIVLNSHRQSDIGMEWIVAIPGCAWRIDRLIPGLSRGGVCATACKGGCSFNVGLWVKARAAHQQYRWQENANVMW